MRKKVGIITLYRGFNYGTSLQAFALKKYIGELGYEGEIIWTKENVHAGRDIRVGKLFRILRRAFLHPRLLKHTVVGYGNNLKNHINDSIKNKFIQFDVEELGVKGLSKKQMLEYAKSEETLALICGSDQIWSAGGANIDPIYFLRFAPEKKRIAYAPSFGSDKIPDYNKKIIKKYISDIPYLSVREEGGARIIKDLLGRTVPVLSDPTLLLDWNDWKGLRRIEPEPYMVVYFLNNPYKGITEYIDTISRKKHCKIVAFPYQFSEYEKLSNIEYLNIGPKEFISVIANSKGVFTDSFHGTAFSINFKIPFITFERNYGYVTKQSERIISILNKFSLMDRFINVTREKNINTDFDSIDFSEVEEKLIKERVKAKKYLLDSFASIV